ncbi:MAG TPA: response regulator transcription factor, partial [Acidimicrobiales bacterium]
MSPGTPGTGTGTGTDTNANANANANATPAPTAPEHGNSTGNGTVIVVEDDPHIADLVDLYLRREGYRVLLAPDGEKGLQAFNDSDPWIVILDVGLPGARDGYEVCRQIRARSKVPVLFLTARDDEVDRILGLELGADDYLTKPFSPRELVARVKAILRRTRESPPPQEIVSIGPVDVDLRRREARN